MSPHHKELWYKNKMTNRHLEGVQTRDEREKPQVLYHLADKDELSQEETRRLPAGRDFD